jgi:hypothetical protein
LWHGAQWTFIIWGSLHGFYLVFALITKTVRERINSFFFLNRIPFLAQLGTFFFVALAWIFFRAKDVQTAFFIIKKIVLGVPSFLSTGFEFQPLGLSKGNLVLCVLLILLLETVHYWQQNYSLSSVFLRQPVYLRWSVYYGIILTIIFFGVFEQRQFIYFQF